MPKRFPRFNFQNNETSRMGRLKNYNEHDDRDRVERGDSNRDREHEHPHKNRNSTRRVSFKPSLLSNKDGGGGGGGGLKRRMAELAIRTRLEDDEDMGDFASSSARFDDRSHGPRRKGSPIPKGKFLKLVPTTFGWYQVAVQFGHRYSKDDVIRALLNAISPDIFIPHYWRTEKHCVIFFVDDFRIAERLQQVERSIQMPDGYRLSVRVRMGVPIVSVDDTFKEKMKLAMVKRYNANTRALDLSKFHADPDFKDMFCGLFRTPVMSAALDIIEKNIPNLQALNLNENNITSLESFKNVAQRLPNLKILYLGENKIPSLAHLLVLRNVPIVELVLKNNPLRQRYKDHALYVSEVRRKFPKLLKLDGVELEPQILFDVHDTSSLPSAKASFLCDAAGTDIIRQFVGQYFNVFDSDNRQPLLDAYHEQAMMSVSIPSASQAGRLEAFWKYNRNLRRIMNNEEAIKIRQLKVGRLQVVSTLAEWPKTQHDPQSFSVDLTLFTPKMISFTVAGLFKELESNSSSSSNNNNNSGGDIRHFQRQFIIVPTGGGFCIRNELIFLTSATHAQTRSFLKSNTTMSGGIGAGAGAGPNAGVGLQNRLQHLQQTNVSSVQIPPSMLQPSTSAAAAAAAAQPNEATKMQMVAALSTQSTMNMDWSKKCLEETNWDYNHAICVFEKLHTESKIPPEAFIK